jgi:hypothetical protein
MTDESAAEPNAISPDMLRAMAVAVGVSLTGDRAAGLASPAEQHFAQLRHLDAMTDSSTEPAAEFRLDRWTRPGND